MRTVKALLQSSALPRLEAHMLLQHVLQVPRTWLIAHDTDVLDDNAITHFVALQNQRRDGVPMAYLVGRRDFMQHTFVVSPAVLIPRPETELLVETVIAHLQCDVPPAPRVLDLGTGSGAIAISVALAHPSATVVATDISDDALAVAKKNAELLGAAVEFYNSNWYDGLIDSPPFDVIVSNPPYIAVDDDHLITGDLRFEPAGALTDGDDGLQAFRTIIGLARAALNPDGVLWVEHGWDQAQAVRQLLHDAGFKHIETRCDLADIERISGGYL